MVGAKTTAEAAPPANGEVRVEKVDKIGFDHNLVTKPMVYGSTRPTTVMERPVADVSIYGNKIGPPLAGRMASKKDIDKYIEMKIKQFNQPSVPSSV